MIKIAVLLATFNGEHYLKDLLNSLLEQTYKDFSIYISDDGSTDNTRIIISEYIQRFPNKIFDISCSKKHNNPRDNFFYLLKNVKADVYFFCDQDDVWLPNKIELFMNCYVHEQYSKPRCIYCDMKVVDEHLKTISESFNYFQKINLNKLNWRYYLAFNNIAGCSLMINEELASLFRENETVMNLDNIVMHDHFFVLLSTILNDDGVTYIDKPLVLYRQHMNNNVGARKQKNLKGILYKIFIKDKKNIILAEKQVQEALKLIDKSNIQIKKYRVINTYSELQLHNKFFRIYFILKNRIIAYSFIKRLYRLLVI